MTKPIKEQPYEKRIHAKFYVTESGNEPVKESLLELGRHTVMRSEFRTLFFVYGSLMILVHFFQKKTQKTPKSDLDLAWDRMKKWTNIIKEP